MKKKRERKNTTDWVVWLRLTNHTQLTKIFYKLVVPQLYVQQSTEVEAQSLFVRQIFNPRPTHINGEHVEYNILLLQNSFPIVTEFCSPVDHHQRAFENRQTT